MSEAKHTPLLPLRLEGPSGRTLVDAGGQPIVSASRPSAERTEILRFIVRAVNSHAALVEALGAACGYLSKLPQHPDRGFDVAALKSQAEAALKLAGKGE